MTDSYEEVQPKTFKFGGVGDFIQGTLTAVEKTTAPDAYGKLSHIYSVLAEQGSFIGSTKNEKTGKYVPDTEPTVITKGEQYTVFISNDKGVVLGKMKDVAIGQKFKMLFAELKPTTKGNDAKLIKVFAGKTAKGEPLMDQEWLDAQKSSFDQM